MLIITISKNVCLQGHFYAAVNIAECALHIGDEVAEACTARLSAYIIPQEICHFNKNHPQTIRFLGDDVRFKHILPLTTTKSSIRTPPRPST